MMITSRTNSRKITLLNHNKPANKSSNCIVVPSPLALKKTLHHHKVVNNHLNSHRIKLFREGANKQVISSQADSLIKISRIWADFFPANTSNQPI
ncbi:hypothetical protein ACWJSM_26885, partial [Klebsiella pneumoniae]